MKYSLHPYKGYLNTKFRLFCDGDREQEVVIKRISDSSEVKTVYVQPNQIEQISLDEPGEYSVVEKGGEQHIAQITVQDGYKFGGSSFKKSFVFENTPWVFVVMHDRTYFHNRNTGYEYMEAISPDTIEYVSPSMVIMSNDRQDVKTLYSLDEERPVLAFSNLVFKNEEVIIWKTIVNEDEFELCIARLDNLNNVKRITCCDDFVVLDDQRGMCFHNQGKVMSVPFDDLLVKKGTNYFGRFLTFLNTSYVVSAIRDDEIQVKSLKDDTEYRVHYEGSLASVNEKIFVDTNQVINKINEFCQEEIPMVSVETRFVSLELFASPNMFVYKESIESYAFKNGRKYTLNKAIQLKDVKGNVLANLDTDYTRVYTHDKLVCLVAGNNIYIVGSKYGRFLKQANVDKVYNTPNYLLCAISEDNKTELYSINGNGYLNKLGFNKEEYSYDMLEDYGILKNKKTSELDIIKTLNSTRSIGRFRCLYNLKGIVVTHSGNTVYKGGVSSDLSFTSISENGNYGLICEDGECTLYENKIDFGRNKKAENYIKSRILSDIYDNTSYSNVFLSEDGKHILSVTKDNCQMLNVASGETEEFGNLSFLRHINGIRPYFNRNQYRQVKFINPLSGMEIDTDAIAQYNFVSPDGNLYADSRLEEYIEYYNLIEERELTKEEYLALISYYCYDSHNQECDQEETKYDKRMAFCQQHLEFFKNRLRLKGWRERSDEEWLDCLTSEKGVYRHSVDFLQLFIDLRGIALIRRTSDNTIANKIKLGSPLWFLNYVAFSHDSRYVAIAGRYPNNTGHGGLLLVYDLVEDEEVYKQTNGYAVWLSAFTKHGHFAAYSSEPTSYFGVVPKENDSVRKIDHFSFLTFSPDGRYVALSKQGYVAWNNGLNPNWGHQPSCLVSVRKTYSANEKIVEYEDLSDEGIEGTGKAKSVSSVSFSKDNSKLMMVGRDGVVIIRNTHLCE